MDMLLVNMPRRSRILARSVIRGAGWGSVSGLLVLLGLALVIACASDDFAVLGLSLSASWIAAVAGMVFGMACGVSAGIFLILLRCKPGVSRAAVRMTGATGAALVPAALLVAMPVTGMHWYLAAGALTAVAFGLGAAGCPAVFYDERRERLRP